jgi:hypothetical protein
MLSFFLYVIKNKNKLKLNSDVYNVSTRQKHNFHQPSSYLSLYMKKESTQLAWKCLTVSHKVSKISVVTLNNLYVLSFSPIDEWFIVNEEW